MVRLLLLLLGAGFLCSEASLLYLTEHTTSHLHAYDPNTGAELLKVEAGVELRGMVPFGASLLVAQAPGEEGYVWNLTSCITDPLPAIRFSNAALQHPYGLALLKGEVLIISNQDSVAIVTYNMTTGEEMKNGFPPISGMRGLSTDEDGLVYVCSKDANSVLVFKGISGTLIGSISVLDPIGVFARPGSLLYVTQGSDSGNVLAFNRTMANFPSVWTSGRTLGHGAGIDFDPSNANLFVNEQDTNSVLVFDGDSGAYRSTLLSGLKNKPEQLMFVACDN